MTYEEANEAIKLMLWTSFRSPAEQILGYEFDSFWPFEKNSKPAKNEKFWIRVSRQTLSEELSGPASDIGGPALRRWDVAAILYVQMFYPVSDKNAAKNFPKLAQLAKLALQDKHDPTNFLWTGDTTIRDNIPSEEAWFRINVVCEFTYQELRG